MTVGLVDHLDCVAQALGDVALGLAVLQQQLRAALAEPDLSFMVTPVAAEAHFVRDHDGVVKPAGDVERRRAFGVDVVQLPRDSSITAHRHDVASWKRAQVIRPLLPDELVVNALYSLLAIGASVGL